MVLLPKPDIYWKKVIEKDLASSTPCVPVLYNRYLHQPAPSVSLCFQANTQFIGYQ